MVPTILTIAGSDSSGGAGIQADLKAISACGGYAASVLTAVTAQNTCGVQAAEDLPLGIIRSQLEAVFGDLDVAAVKTGMLSSAAIVEVVAAELAARRPAAVVVDPVMISKTGFALLADEAVDAVTSLLLPRATVVTPNVHEAQRLAGFDVRTAEDAERAGHAIRELGAAAVLVKGGHLEGAPGLDVLVTESGAERFAGDWVETKHTHGIGCTYSAAIATHLALGRRLGEAIRLSGESRVRNTLLRRGVLRLRVPSGRSAQDDRVMERSAQDECSANSSRVSPVTRIYRPPVPSASRRAARRSELPVHSSPAPTNRAARSHAVDRELWREMREGSFQCRGRETPGMTKEVLEIDTPGRPRTVEKLWKKRAKPAGSPSYDAITTSATLTLAEQRFPELILIGDDLVRPTSRSRRAGG